MGYKIETIELPSKFIGMENGHAYMLESGVWVRVIGKVGPRLYKVYSGSSLSDLPPVVKDEDR